MRTIKSHQSTQNCEKGATLVEASLILPIFILFIFGIILISAQLFSTYSTYYACLQSLKIVSTGPVRDENGAIIKSVEDRLYSELSDKLKKFRTGEGINNVLFRNSLGCYTFNGSKATAYINESIGCPENSGEFKISPNTWISVELKVRPLGLSKAYIPLPEVNVKSTVKMYDWA